MTRRGFVLALALAGSTVTSAGAATYVSVEARWGQGSDRIFAESSDDPTLANDPVVSASAVNTEEGGSASFPDQFIVCDQGASCGLQLPATGLALARAGANGLDGVLRGRSAALEGGGSGPGTSAESLARITDMLTFTGPQLLFEFDIDLAWALTDLGISNLAFRFGHPAPSCAGVPDCMAAPFIFTELNVFAYRDADFSEFGYTLFKDGLVVEEEDFISDQFQFSYNFAVPPCFPLFGFVCPPPGTPNSANFFFELETSAEAFEGTGTALMAADNSAFIKIANATSLNGYSYAGRPGGAPVPEPATWAMMILGFAFIGAALRQQRRRPLLRPTR